jgi:hypothetical protein
VLRAKVKFADDRNVGPAPDTGYKFVGCQARRPARRAPVVSAWARAACSWP